MSEPFSTAVALALIGVLLGLSVLASRGSGRFGVPVALLFLGVGMAAGLAGIAFDDHRAAFRLGTVALVLILLDGGLSTPVASVRRVFAPAAILATAGVAGTALLAAVGGRMLRLPWGAALLFGAIVSSTDAAAVFSVLRGARIQLRRRVAQVLELESGLNDPMAVILTVAFTTALVEGHAPGISIVGGAAIQLAVGGAVGIGAGRAGRWVLARARLSAGGLYPVLTLGLALATFGAATILHGSGFLAVYALGVVLGNGPLPYRTGLVRVHDAMAWFAQVSMFLLLGLLADSGRLVEVALPGVALALLLAFVARPVAVAACLAPLRFAPREVTFVAWVGLRGAVPIILATYPVLAGAPGARRIFDLVFFAVVVSTLLQGATIRWLARRLDLEVAGTPAPRAVLEIVSREPLAGEVLSFYVEAASAAAGSVIADLPFPEGATIMLVVRGHELVPPRGQTVLQPGDHVYVFTRPEEKGLVLLLFGREEEG
ncbi:potassium/proton antiporter [Anaeromyxobacter oryzae]|uniref:K+/H+ antiporter n=1 Tax=Anaeromyxobacter oryzae TaxID=2918170 RepID=A0ABN6MUA3_9BACT|nr:potassium/proton antiporter [Anaeromyxobacter oryzae]BDG04557.1 K+/H+ antiporter [Anaeromyxobacter oryzae]